MPKDEAHSYLKKALKLAEEPKCDFEGAYPYLVKAHEAGIAEVTYAIGSWYFYGRYLKQDIGQAIKFWKIAAEKDSIDASTELANYHELGEHTEQDMSQALAYWMKAALLGDAKSMYEVGRPFYYGEGVNKDHVLSDVWMDAAERNGYVEPESEEE